MNITGIHHITAIAGNARRNYHFYTQILGLRLVKKTVNFDDPTTYHFYFGDATGTPGTILTFFPWEGIQQGRRGTGMVTEFSFAVPLNSIDFWISRFDENNIIYNKPAEKFGERYLTFVDPDGLKIELTETADDNRLPWTANGIQPDFAIKGFRNATLTVLKKDKTADILTQLFNYKLIDSNVNRYRYVTEHSTGAKYIDIVEAAGEARGINAGGTVHHIAFRVDNRETQKHFREALTAHGLEVTPVIDRNYFHSIYFREPGGVLFEIATDEPGFTVDESSDVLGTELKLPAQYEIHRQQIESALPRLD